MAERLKITKKNAANTPQTASGRRMQEKESETVLFLNKKTVS